jgi:hypothetical protein
MYGALAMLDAAGKLEKGERVYLRDLKGKDEAWLRDTLFHNPEIIPVDDIDVTFGPLIPLCTELRTSAGNIDAVFINDRGRLTIVECKLWNNPQARREVVAQTLDYVSALSGWNYADLQRQVSVALRRQGNVPFELAQNATAGALRESSFIDSVSRCLREGRFLILLVGDGIREGMHSLTELVNRNSTKAFTFGVIEAALYKFQKSQFAIQPRVFAKTENVMRHMTVLNIKGAIDSVAVDDAIGEVSDGANELTSSKDKKHLKEWWRPVIEMKFDDPEQDAPKWLGTNNVSLATPYPGIQIKAYATVDGKQMGVYVTGSAPKLGEVEKLIRREKKYLQEHLPIGTIIEADAGWPIVLRSDTALSDANRHAWLKEHLNEFTNVLRPLFRKWYDQTHE